MSGRTAKCVADKLYACKKCGKMPVVDQIRYYQNLGTKEAPNWIGCVDLECFKQQGGTYDPNAQTNKFASSKFPISDAPRLYTLAEELLEAFIKKYDRIPDPKELSSKTQSFTTIEFAAGMSTDQKAQFLESMFKTLSGNFKP